MNNKNVFISALCLFLCLLGLTGCLRPQVIESSIPEWVKSGSGPYLSEHGKVFHGVGVALGFENRMLLRASADNLAREELAGVLGRYTQELFDEAAIAITDADQVDPANQSLGALTIKNLDRSIIVDHWIDLQHGGRMYSLCRLKLHLFKENLSHHKALPPELRRKMMDLANPLHDKMMQ